MFHPGHISYNGQNRLLSAGMPLVEGVGGLILPEDCQDQNHKRKFMVLLLHRIAASLVLPQLRRERTIEAQGSVIVQALLTVP